MKADVLFHSERIGAGMALNLMGPSPQPDRAGV